MSNTEWQLFTKEIEDKLTLYSLFESPTSNSLVICKTTFTLWTYTLRPMTWFYFLMMNCSKLKANQVSELQKNYESMNSEGSKFKNILNLTLLHQIFLLILADAMAWHVGQPEWFLCACASTSVLCLACHWLSNRKTFRWREAWHKARFSALNFFSVDVLCISSLQKKKIFLASTGKFSWRLSRIQF